MRSVIIGKNKPLQPLFAIIYSTNPSILRLTFNDNNARKAIVVICFSGIEITVPVPGTDYIANTQYGVLANGNLVGGDGGRNTSTWCVWKGAVPDIFFISGLTSRTTYKILLLEYTDDTNLDYSQEIRTLNETTSNYKTATTRR